MPTYNSLTGRTDAQATMPEDVAKEIIRGAAQKSVVMSMFRRVPMSRAQQRQPVLSALAQAYWVSGDTGLKQTTKEAWANQYLNAEEIAVIVPVPQAVLDDSDYDLFEEMKPDIEEAVGQALDLAALFGINKPSSWPTAIVPGAVAAGNSLTKGSVSGQDIAGDLNAIMKLVAADGLPVTGFAADALLEYDLQGLRDSQGRPIFVQDLTSAAGNRLYGRPFTYLNNGGWDATQAVALAGDMSKAILGVRQDITYSVHTEGVITDGSGAVVLNLMQQDSAALRLVCRFGFQVANPITRRNTNSATRYPFAALTP